jgi:hypothetical protein
MIVVYTATTSTITDTAQMSIPAHIGQLIRAGRFRYRGLTPQPPVPSSPSNTADGTLQVEDVR